MKHKLLTYTLFFTLSVMLISCGTSTGSRFPRGNESGTESKEKKTMETVKKPVEDFDMTPYTEKLPVEEVQKPVKKSEVNAWYDYSQESSPIKDKTIAGSRNGFRVQVIATDDLEEANSIRSEIYFKTNQKHVYLVFDPPFYKVKVGDFTEVRDANDLSFKLSQMGFNECRVVSELVNIYE